MNPTEKKATDDRSKYVKAMLASAIAAAGIGAVAKNIKERKIRAEANDVSSSRNTIVVPILKSRFMDGLPTPDELKKSRGEVAADAAAQIPGQVKNPQQNAELTPEEIALRKKEIIGGRKFDFFGKKAEKSSVFENTEKSVEGDKKDKNGDEGKDRRIIFRDQNGKFVSPSDPVAVESVEKSAEGEGYDWVRGLYNTVFHPIDTVGVMFNAAKDKPVLMTAGAVGSIILAAKISDSINKMRRERSKNRLDDARSKYVALLEGSDGEKTAQAQIEPDADPRVSAGALIGGAFVVPLALTALVTNRIIENRRNEKKREKEISDSYPDEPVILYKTSEDKEIRISPETALFAIMMKQAMIESAERDEREAMSKEAQQYKLPSGVTVDNAERWIMKHLGDPRNNDILLELAKKKMAREDVGLDQDIIKKMFSRMDPSERKAFGRDAIVYGGSMLLNPKFKNDVINRVMTGKNLQNIVIERLTDDKYADSWGQFKNDKISEALTGYGFAKGGLLHRMFSWILNNTGLGNYFVKNNINDYFAQMRDAGKAQAQATPAAQNAQVAQTAAATDQAPAASPTATAPAAKDPAHAPAPAPAQTASLNGFAPGSTAGTPTKSIA